MMVAVSTVAANGLPYGVGHRDGEFSFEALDWKTGKAVFHYLLGKSFIFNPTGFTTRIAPNGAIDLSSMGAAVLRLSPKAYVKQHGETTMIEIDRIFTEQELADLAQHPADRAVAAINAGQLDAAKEICRQSENCHKFVHDSIILAWDAQSLAHIYRKHGCEGVEKSLRESVPPWFRPIAELFRNGVNLQAVGYLAQMCRMDCGKFNRVVEDDDTIVFRIDQCGSGGRLVQDGHYAEGAPMPLPLIKEAGPLTGGIADFPLFCSLCRMAETLMIEWLGYPAFVTDCVPEQGGAFASGGTRLTIYKDPKAIPLRYFSRVGKTPEEGRLAAAPCVSGGRIFTNEQLADLPVPWVTQALSALEADQADLAKGYLCLSKYEWNPVHDLGVTWAAGNYAYIYKNYGVEELYKFSCVTYNDVIMAPYENAIRSMDVKTIVQGWAVNWHNHASKFSLSEDAEKVTFRLAPCGSGGRLINERAYDPDSPKHLVRVKEAHKVGFNRKEFPIYCIHTATTNELLLKSDCAHPFIWDASKLWKAGDCCVMHVYKNRDAIPERLYREVDLNKPKLK